jgi:hypothetical protein
MWKIFAQVHRRDLFNSLCETYDFVIHGGLRDIFNSLCKTYDFVIDGGL